MSISIKIHYKKPKKASDTHYFEGYHGEGSFPLYDKNSIVDCAHFNITGNLFKMCSYITCKDPDTGYVANLCTLLWNYDEDLPEKYNVTDNFKELLFSGICNMIQYKESLLKFEHKEWGTYQGLLLKLLNMLDECRSNPGCMISRH